MEQMNKLRLIPLFINITLILYVIGILTIITFSTYKPDDLIFRNTSYLSLQINASIFVNNWSFIFLVTAFGFFLLRSTKHRIILLLSSLVGFILFTYSFSYITPW